MSEWMFKKCSIDECPRPVAARGWCARHYQQWRAVNGKPRKPKPRRSRPTTEERFWSYVNRRTDDECWPWTGSTISNGYGLMYLGHSSGGRKQVAHRYAYELLVGPIPTGMTLDHLCHTAVAATCREGDACPHRRCVNPAHLEPTSGADNCRRGAHAAKTHCANGHPYDEQNTRRLPNGHRECVACRREQRPLVGNRNAQKTHCKRGHEFTPENTRVIPVSDRLPNGGRACKQCEREHQLRRKPPTGKPNPVLANIGKTHCKRGHEFTEENTYRIPTSAERPRSGRACKQCQREKQRRLSAAKKLATL